MKKITFVVDDETAAKIAEDIAARAPLVSESIQQVGKGFAILPMVENDIVVKIEETGESRW